VSIHSFASFLIESSHSLHAFDMDETLFSHDPSKLKIHVNDADGNRVASLTNQEFNHHKLVPGHSYDFSDFKSSSKLHQTAKPIRKMIAKMKAINKHGGRTAIVTARANFDDQPKFKEFMDNYGIDIDKVHVYRAGNMPGPPPETKRKVVSDLIKKHGYKSVHLYDDSKENLAHFLSLKQDHPDVNFHAHHVNHDHETGHTSITTTSV
jgi:hypothetical protein